MSDSLYGRLLKLSESDLYSFHMPGHKRLWSPKEHELYPRGFYSFDVSEISGFDNLHFPQDILKDAQEKAAAIYHADETFYLINGSTAGILSAVSAIDKTRKLLISRHSHFSVYHAAYLNDIQPVYIYPEYDKETGLIRGITADQVAKKLKEEPDIGTVLITSPTYEGAISDVYGIANTVHEHGALLIVDQAHGAHFGFHPAFPESAVKQGADIVIHSLHKTLPALTQTALLHVSGNRVNRRKLKRFLRIYQSSSPSYPLMAGIEACLDFVKDKGEAALGKMLELREGLTDRVSQLSQFYILPSSSQNFISFSSQESMKPENNDCCNNADRNFKVNLIDPCKIIIVTKTISGKKLAAILREDYLLEMEMAADNYVIAIITMADSLEGIMRLSDALIEIEAKLPLAREEKRDKFSVPYAQPFAPPPAPEIVTTIKEAYDGEAAEVLLADALGKVASEFAFLYPPGIPLIVPGEKLNRDIIKMVKEQGDSFWILR
ncbi:MAG: aminotransferase class I/II-fold pyridoxal phosphate-dependent enzyme [Lachnospiraceae bacterium]|nr:aminotransferase class I/II-fold pyridoxal phosphate-dependent enzyme [Lachnospiraceae bacterium]